MGREKLKIMRTLLCMCLICVSLPITAEAGNLTRNAKKLVKQMGNYETGYISSHNITSRKTVKLTNAQKAKAAALSIPVKQLKPLKRGEFGGYVLWKLTKKKFHTASKNLFGKSISTSRLRKNPEKSSIGFFNDAYRNARGTPVVYYTDGETEMDYAVTKISVAKQKGRTYKVAKYIFFGPWMLKNGKPNYKIVYTVARNKKSKYGCVIKGMSIQRLAIQ